MINAIVMTVLLVAALIYGASMLARGTQQEQDLYVFTGGVVEGLLSDVNAQLVLSLRPMPEKVDYAVQSGDSLAKLAARQSALQKLYDLDLMAGSGHLRGYRVDDPDLEHVHPLHLVRVVAHAFLLFARLRRDHATVQPRVLHDLPDRLLEGALDNVDPERFLAGSRNPGQSRDAAQQCHPAAGDDPLFHGRPGGVEGILDARYDYDAAKPILTLDTLADRGADIWRYAELLPMPAGIRRPDVQVGWTPVHEVPRLAEAVGVRRLFLKDEGRNPTSSFKDRASAVGVAMRKISFAKVLDATVALCRVMDLRLRS